MGHLGRLGQNQLSRLSRPSWMSRHLQPRSFPPPSSQTSFISLAENFATLVSDRQYLQVLLAKCDNTNELFESDKQLGTWVKESITAIESFKNHQGVKQACTWVKAGGKVSNGFSLFK